MQAIRPGLCRQCRLSRLRWRDTTTIRLVASYNVAPGSIRSQRQTPRIASSRQSYSSISTLNEPDTQDLSKLWNKVEDLARIIRAGPTEHESPPREQDVLSTLKFYEQTADRLLHQGKTSKPSKDQASDTSDPPSASATSALLESADVIVPPSAVTRQQLLRNISRRAAHIIEYPAVSIGKDVLKTYISLQSKFNKPQSFPHVLTLYRKRSSDSSPAVEPDVAANALDAAMRHRDLDLCLSIVEQTYADPAFARAKLMRTALGPATIASLFPVAAYILARRFALIQDTMEQGTATGVAMAGIVTYAAVVATMGYVTITTSNDQMKRVTWATGLPLWERWAREEERAAIEAIAMSWGFKSQERWGDEEGAEWDHLKEWAGVRGMVIDRVSLMEGME